jgi:cellulose synthase/poly-beta-1,6-N-acetylglucosamine synthase-like glycosyltransferase
MAQMIFWAAFVGMLYVYAGYPLLLAVWRRLAPRPIHKRHYSLGQGRCEPTVSIVIAMGNENRNVLAKMRNCMELDYPASKLQIIASLDAPTDGTDTLVRRCPGVEVVSSQARIGKAGALNKGVERATGEILLFVDSRQHFEKHALREIVANFADQSVGAVSGELILLDERGQESSDGAGTYWRYEKKIRAMESAIHSVPGATGAIYAIRRELFVPLSGGIVLDDVVIPMRIVLGGWRAIFDSAARAYDGASESPEREYQRKTRTLAGNYQLLVELPELLLPWRNPIFVQFVSHKLGRLLVPYGLAAFFISNLFLAGIFYRTVLACQVFWYLLAVVGWLLSTQRQSHHAAISNPGA